MEMMLSEICLVVFTFYKCIIGRIIIDVNRGQVESIFVLDIIKMQMESFETFFRIISNYIFFFDYLLANLETVLEKMTQLRKQTVQL